jgi:hypothetical protein
LVDFGLRHPLHPKREGHIRADRFVRIKRVVLEHHRDVALCRGQVVDRALVDPDRTGCDPFKPRDHPQKRGLATARRPHQHNELAILNGHTHAMKNLHWTKRFTHVADVHRRHRVPPVAAIGCRIFNPV